MAKKKRYYQSDKMSNPLSGMVHEDFSKPSNLPTEVIMKQYPKTNSVYQDYDYDTLEDANRCIDQSASKARGHRKEYGRY